MLALWHSTPNSSGGSRRWRSDASELVRDARRLWAAESKGRTLPALPSTLDVLLFLLKTMMRGFRGNSMATWKPFLVLALGLVGVDLVDLLEMVRMGLRSGMRDVPLLFNLLVSKISVDLPGPNRRACAGQSSAEGGDRAEQNRRACAGQSAEPANPHPVGSVVEQEMDARAQRQQLEIDRITNANGAFDVLGIPSSATSSEIRSAWRRVSLLVHPDKCSFAGGQVAFVVLRKAYDLVSKP